MRDLLVGFEGETKTFRDALCPTEKHGFRGHAIEAVIDFDGRELFGVEREHLLVRKFFRIEVSLPLFVGVAGSADAELAGAWNGRPPRSRPDDSK